MLLRARETVSSPSLFDDQYQHTSGTNDPKLRMPLLHCRASQHVSLVIMQLSRNVQSL